MMDFGEIAGQKEIISILTGLIENDRVGHAYIFNGPVGIGKKTIAKIFASMLLCERSGPRGSCETCRPCLMLSGGTNPDFFTITTEDAAIGVDEIRKMQSDIVVKPLYSPRKVYLIPEADKMTVQAQNCLLKTLEEPPKYAVIILTASNCDALLETVKSRSARLNFKKNTSDEVVWVLKDRLGLSGKDADFLASYADGVIGMALEMAGTGEFFTLREKTVEVSLKLLKSKLLDVFDIYDFFETNKSNIDVILNIMLLFYRDMLVAKNTGKGSILINSDKKDIILSNVGSISTRGLISSIEAIETASKNIKRNVNFQLCIEVMLMKLQEEIS